MARRSDHNRDELYVLILKAAREIAEVEGLRGLTARRIADRIGYAPGTLYNVFANLDDIIICLRGETLDDLYGLLSTEKINGEPETILIGMANRYIQYVRENPKLWNLMFEHKLPDHLNIPDWYHGKTLQLLNLVENTLNPYFSSKQQKEQSHHAQVLWTALQGICSIQIAGKLVKKESAEAMAKSLISTYLKGLQ